MNANKKSPTLQFSISRSFRNADDLRQWIQNSNQDKTNNGFLNIQPVKYMDDSDHDDTEDEQYYYHTPIKNDAIYNGTYKPTPPKEPNRIAPEIKTLNKFIEAKQQ